MAASYSVRKYMPQDLNLWNTFVYQSANGTFLVDRHYLSYHKNRISDYSLMVFKNHTLFAILPAHFSDNVLYSHKGLTFGGLMVLPYVRTQDYLACWHAIINYCKAHLIQSLEYQPTPTLFHRQQEVRDTYFMYRLNAKLSDRKLASVKNLTSYQGTFSKGKHLNIGKAIKKNSE